MEKSLLHGKPRPRTGIPPDNGNETGSDSNGGKVSPSRSPIRPLDIGFTAIAYKKTPENWWILDLKAQRTEKGTEMGKGGDRIEEFRKRKRVWFPAPEGHRSSPTGKPGKARDGPRVKQTASL